MTCSANEKKTQATALCIAILLGDTYKYYNYSNLNNIAA